MVFPRFKNPKFVLVLTLLFVIPFITYNLVNSPKKPTVLSTQTYPSSSPIISSRVPATSPSPTPTPPPSKLSYTIAIIGDSMVDTMGENLPYLLESLNNHYPTTNFKLYNYGIGGQNVAQGAERFENEYNHQNRSYPAISQIKADIIIVGSFAYNPFDPHDRNRHWLTLTDLVDKAKATQADIYILAEIAPLKNGFGKGPNGINWPPDIAASHASLIVEQLENAVALSNKLDIPLINAFEKSQASGKYGSAEYTDQNDGIHPSVIGHQFMADLIAQTIILP